MSFLREQFLEHFLVWRAFYPIFRRTHPVGDQHEGDEEHGYAEANAPVRIAAALAHFDVRHDEEGYSQSRDEDEGNEQ